MWWWIVVGVVGWRKECVAGCGLVGVPAIILVLCNNTKRNIFVNEREMRSIFESHVYFYLERYKLY